MTDVVVFHHAQGLTSGVRAFAQSLTDAGHTVTVPDLYEGATFATVADGVAHAEQLRFDTVRGRGHVAVGELPGALGGVLIHGCIPVAESSAAWPAGVAVQIHGMDADPYFVAGGDLRAAHELVAAVPEAELFLYPGDRHQFADSSVAGYEPAAAALLTERVLTFLAER